MARYLPEQKLLFQHIPRTGGVWIEKAMQVADIRCSRWIKQQPHWICGRHALLSHYHVDAIRKVNRLFTMVRHPVAYYKSVWNYLMDQSWFRLSVLQGSCEGKSWTWHPFRAASLIYEPGMPFVDWAYYMIKHQPMWYTRIIDQYVGPKGGEFVDFIGRTESLADDFFLAMEVFKVPNGMSQKGKQAVANLERINAGRTVPNSSAHVEQTICSVESEVIERFYHPDRVEQRYYNRLLNSAAYHKGRPVARSTQKTAHEEAGSN